MSMLIIKAGNYVYFQQSDLCTKFSNFAKICKNSETPNYENCGCAFKKFQKGNKATKFWKSYASGHRSLAILCQSPCPENISFPGACHI